MQKLFLLVVLFSLISISCKKDNTNPTNPDQNAYTGRWKMTISGQATGTSDFYVSPTGTLSGLITVSYSGATDLGSTISDSLSGTVSKSGDLKGSIVNFNSSARNNNGEFDATLYATQGSGTYSLYWQNGITYQPQGTWTATKY